MSEDLILKTSSRATWKDQYKQLGNQSKFHEAVRTIFCEDQLFKNLHCYQEVAVAALIEEYPYTSHHYDWFVDEMGAVIELHGRQHYHPTSFGGVGYDTKIHQFKQIQHRDNLKREAAISAGYTYVEVPYTEQKLLTGDFILAAISRSNRG